MEILEGQYSKLSIVDLTTNKEIVVITDDQITTTDDFAVKLEPAWTNASITKAAPKERRKGGVMEREQTTIRLPADLKEQVQQKADEMGISFNETVMIAIEKFISHQSWFFRGLFQTVQRAL